MSEAALAALLAGDTERFLAARRETLIELENRFLEDKGVPPPRRSATPDDRLPDEDVGAG